MRASAAEVYSAPTEADRPRSALSVLDAKSQLSMEYRVDLHETPGELEDLAPEWRRLAERAGNPFASPEWFGSILPDLSPASRPAVIGIRRLEGDLVGVFPFVRSSSRSGAELSLAGAELADILQPAAAPDHEEGAARALGEALPALHVGGPIRLGRVDSAAGWWRVLAGASSSARVAVLGPPDQLPYLLLPSSWDEYKASRSRSFRSQLGRKMRSLRRDHDVVITRVTDAPGLEAALESLFRLHDRRWEQRAGDSAFAPSTRAFHRRLVGATTSAGWTRIFVMEIDGAPAAAWYGWRLGDRTLYYQSGFDPAWQRHSVGFLLLAETIKGAIEEGCSEYDMLLGDESFKARFADRAREGRRVTLARRISVARLRAEVHMGARRAWWALRKRDRAGPQSDSG